jgi:hypothetical protein
MGNLTDAERPQAPRPAYYSMPNAVRAAILSGNTLADIRLPAWADTYRTSEEAIRGAWEAEMSRQSQQPINSFDVEGK